MERERFLQLKSERGSLRCPYCHDGLAAEELLENCDECRAGHHEECWGLHGGCSACGLRSETAPRDRGRSRLIVLGQADRLDLEWGDRQTVARRMLFITALILIPTLILGLIALGSLALAKLGLITAPRDAAEVLPVSMYAAIWGLVFLVVHIKGALQSGRLRVSAEGIEQQRMTALAKYRGDELLPWSEAESFDVIGSRAPYFVTAEGPSGLAFLARAKNKRSALRIKRQLQAARAHFCSGIEPGTIQIRPSGGENA